MKENKEIQEITPCAYACIPLYPQFCKNRQQTQRVFENVMNFRPKSKNPYHLAITNYHTPLLQNPDPRPFLDDLVLGLFF